MKSGIYTWVVRRGDKPPLVYVGQAVDLRRRKAEYETDFKRDDEPQQNRRLCATVRKYGRRAASFNVVYPAEREDLTHWERRFYWHFKDQEALGLCEVANVVEPGDNPLNDPAVKERQREAVVAANRRKSQDPQWQANVVNSLAKHCTLVDPRGNVVEVYNLRAFCRENGLNSGWMTQVANGKYPHYKGWRRYEGEVQYA